MEIEETKEKKIKQEIPIHPDFYIQKVECPKYEQYKENLAIFTKNKKEVIETFKGKWFAIWKSNEEQGYNSKSGNSILDISYGVPSVAVVSYGTENEFVMVGKIHDFFLVYFMENSHVEV